MKTKLFILMTLICTIQIRAQWRQLGINQFSNTAKDADVAVSKNTGHVYVGYIDSSDSDFIKVMKFDNGSWVNYGPTATSVSTDLFTLEVNPVSNEPWICYKEGNGFRVIRYDGTNWVTEYVNSNTSISLAPVGRLQMKFDSSGKATIAGSASATGNGNLLLYSNITGSWSNALSAITVTSGRAVPTLVSATLLKSIYTQNAGTSSEIFDVQYHSFDGTSWSRSINAIFQGTSSLGNLIGLVSYSSAISNRLFITPTDIKSVPIGSSPSSVSTSSLPYVIDYSLSNYNNENYLFYVDNTNKVKLLEGLTLNFDPNIDLTPVTNKFTNISHNDTNGNIYVVYSDGERCSVKFIERQISIQYVNTNATGNNDGTSWTDAYTSLHDALTNAGGNDQIWIASGMYKPDVSDRNISFQFNNNVYGGFDGTEIDVSDRDMSLIHTTNATILSGDLLNNDDATVDFNDSTRSDNSLHVVEVSSNDLTIDGITVQDGYADAITGDDRFGGGIFKVSAVTNLTLKNTVIKNNVAFTGAGLSLTTTASSNINIDACIIEGNLANGAAGLDFHLSGTSASMNMIVTNSLFKDNRTEDDTSKGRLGSGASAGRFRAVFSGVDLNLIFVNNTLVNNQSNGTTLTSDFPVLDITRTSGLFGNITVANNIFWDNTANANNTTKAIGRSANSFSINFLGIEPDITVDNNIDEDGLSLVHSTNTFNANPNLSTDFKLTTGSYAIDAGVNSYLPSGIIADLGSYQRIFNTTVDMGAYEFGAPAVLGVDDFGLETPELVIYPNPVSNILNIQNQDGQISEISIFNMLGQQVLKTKNKQIDVSNFKNGIYILKAKTSSRDVVRRFVKQ